MLQSIVKASAKQPLGEGQEGLAGGLDGNESIDRWRGQRQLAQAWRWPRRLGQPLGGVAGERIPKCGNTTAVFTSSFMHLASTLQLEETSKSLDRALTEVAAAAAAAEPSDLLLFYCVS